jgi:signal transduction histidine kinase
VDPDKSNQIYDAFFTTKPEGMGMGLAICRSIVEVHGGRLWVEQRRPNGSIFSYDSNFYRPPKMNIGPERYIFRLIRVEW